MKDLTIHKLLEKHEWEEKLFDVCRICGEKKESKTSSEEVFIELRQRADIFKDKCNFLELENSTLKKDRISKNKKRSLNGRH